MRRLILTALVFAALTSAIPAVPHAQAPAAPRLLVVLVVDQMRADYLTTFEGRWKAGFRTLLTRGAQFVNAEYPYWSTITCAGHASIGTGTLPRTHGMVLNRWWDRAERKVTACTDDHDSPAVSYQRPAAEGHSAKRLLVSTLADEVRAQRPGARVVSLSLKPRSAVGLAGHGGDAVIWFDTAARSFVTSRAFTPAPTPEIAAFMARDNFETDQALDWQLADAGATYRYPDVVSGERPNLGWTALFPHRLAGVAPMDAAFADHWQKSPYADAFLGRLAAALVGQWRLGQRETTDFLGVSFSALDAVGHDFGPRSREVEDMLMRLDVTIGALIDQLDRVVGRDKYVLALSADHGVAVIPEQAGAGRIANEDLRAIVEEALIGQWGRPATGTYVDATTGGQIYLADGIFDRLRAQAGAQAMRAVERALLDVPGLARVVGRDELGRAGDPVTQAMARGYVEGRSGDLFIVPKQDWIVEQRFDNDATTHGTMYEYDRRVPLILMGEGLTPGRYTEAATPLDIAPTLAQRAGIRFLNRDGRPLQPQPQTRSH
jgi:predicted AlkP superfamily pyrophosphatase or phosphodiesterase